MHFQYKVCKLDEWSLGRGDKENQCSDAKCLCPLCHPSENVDQILEGKLAASGLSI